MIDPNPDLPEYDALLAWIERMAWCTLGALILVAVALAALLA